MIGFRCNAHASKLQMFRFSTQVNSCFIFIPNETTKLVLRISLDCNIVNVSSKIVVPVQHTFTLRETENLVTQEIKNYEKYEKGISE